MAGKPYQIKHGTEGPKHDPYSYTEYIMNGVTAHFGLGVWLKLPDGTVIHKTDEISVSNEFAKITGYTPTQLLRFEDRLIEKRRKKCGKCGGTNLDWQRGYPGETLLICQDCNNIIDIE